MKKIVFLQKIGEINPLILMKLKKDLKWVLKNFIDEVKISPEIIPLSSFEYDEGRKQYDASKIIRKLINFSKRQDYKFRVLGILEEDIYTKMLNFVFGIAFIPKPERFLEPCVSLISTARLEETFYRRDEDKSLYELRILKEALHEVGHTLMLRHCENDCVMQFSNCLMDTDNKPAVYCSECLSKLETYFKDLD